MRAIVLGFVIAASAGQALLAQPSAPRGVRPPRPVLGPSSGPRPLLFGFAIDCTRCRLGPRDDDPMPVWQYAEAPRVAAVRPGGAAALGGVAAGDTIVAVEGMSILSTGGARRFSSVRAGDRVRLTLRRDGRELDATVVLPRAGEAPPVGRTAASRPRRYAGEVAGASVEVWSASPVSVVVDSTGALVIQTGTSTVRVAPAAAERAAPTVSRPVSPRRR